jgi:hypothetical protein
MGGDTNNPRHLDHMGHHVFYHISSVSPMRMNHLKNVRQNYFQFFGRQGFTPVHKPHLITSIVSENMQVYATMWD